MRIERRRFEGGTVISVHGGVTSDTAPDLDAELSSLAKKGQTIVVDFADTTVVTSAGLGALLKCYRNLAGGRLLLSSASEDIAEVFGISGLDGVFEFYENADAAKLAARK